MLIMQRGGSLLPLFLAFLIAGGLVGFLGFRAYAPPPKPNLNLTGAWELGTLLSDGRTSKGTFILKQDGDTITGRGLDEQGEFKLNGTFRMPNLSMTKVYLHADGTEIAKPIAFTGMVDWTETPGVTTTIPYKAHMYGAWRFQKREGFGWRAEIVVKTGKWEAGQIAEDRHSGIQCSFDHQP